MSNKQITAVNWLVEQLRMQTPLYTKEQIIEIAKEMEKQDIIDAWYDGVHNWDNEKTPQEYYTETYGGQNNEQ